MGFGANQSMLVGSAPSFGGGVFAAGVQCRTEVVGRITALRFYRSANDAVTTSRTMRLWVEGVTGAAVASAVTVGETPSSAGYVTATFGTPYVTTAGQGFRVTYECPQPHAEGAGTTTGAADVTWLSSCFGVSNAYPGTLDGVNYWADVVFQAGSATAGWTDTNAALQKAAAETIYPGTASADLTTNVTRRLYRDLTSPAEMTARVKAMIAAAKGSS